jgi:hypothetical protein
LRYFKPRARFTRLKCRPPQRIDCQWIEHGPHPRECLRINPRDDPRIDDSRKVLHRHNRDGARHVEVDDSLFDTWGH